MISRAAKLIQDTVRLTRLPKIAVNLMHSATAQNDPFYSEIVKEFYQEARRRHRKFPLVRQFEYGMAVCVLPKTAEEYLALIEPAGRRNIKKAARLGYSLERLDYNRHIEDVREILASTDTRQGKRFNVDQEVKPCSNPPSKTSLHDYPYFGVLKDGKAVAYAGCFVGGEICMIQTIYGHAAHQGDGVVPLLITGVAQQLYEHFPSVKYYVYGTFFGAGETMRRFKTKFAFAPHRVQWVLG